METLKAKEVFVTSDGVEIELPKIKAKKERQILKIVGAALTKMTPETRLALSNFFSETKIHEDDDEALSARGRQVFELLQVVLVELPDQMLSVAAIVTGLEEEELEEKFSYVDIIGVLAIFIRQTAFRFSGVFGGSLKTVLGEASGEASTPTGES